MLAKLKLFAAALLGLLAISTPAAAQSAMPNLDSVQWATTPSGLRYVDTVVGSGQPAQVGRTAVVHYTGWLENGRKFDSSKDRGTPFDFPLGAGRVIRGWDEGVASMRIGGKRILRVPPNLGYGASGAGGVIPPNAVLVFEVELLGVR